MRTGRALLLRPCVVAAVLAGSPAAAQQSQRCQFVIENVDREGARIEVSPGVINYFAGGNVRFRCSNVAVRISSDSVASYQGVVVQFVGNVRYRDTTSEITADFGTYFKDSDKWEARSSPGRTVLLRNLKDGSTLRGPSLDYFRAAPGLRQESEMYADQRPTVTIPVRDSTGTGRDPYVVLGDRIRTRGDDKVWAGGRVTIDRSDFRGRGDSLDFDSGKGSAAALVGRASMHREAADSFDLVGQRIDLQLDQKELTYVTARDSARLRGTDLTLDGDVIGLDVNRRQVEQTVAWGKIVRPLALSSDYEIRGDSVAFDTPGQTLREIRAFRSAWIGAKPDSGTGDRDWIAGDSVRATFATRDSAGVKRPALDRIESRGSARALYRFRQPGEKQPSVTYNKADLIVVTMRLIGDSVTVDSVYARGGVDGVHVQPARFRADSASADSLRAPADTAARKPRKL
jgi:hypothetical protein